MKQLNFTSRTLSNTSSPRRMLTSRSRNDIPSAKALGGGRSSFLSLLKLSLKLFGLVVIGIVGYFGVTQPSNSAGVWRSLIPGGNMSVKYDTYTLFFDDTIDKDTRNRIVDQLKKIKYKDTSRFKVVEKSKDADIEIRFATGNVKDNEALYRSWIVPVGHLYWVKDETSSDQLADLNIYSGSKNSSLVQKVLAADLGKSVKVTPSEDLVAQLESTDSDRVGFVDLSELNPQLKLLIWEGKYFLDDQDGGIPYGIVAQKEEDVPDFIHDILKRWSSEGIAQQSFQFDQDRVVKLNMTGVTAISRSLARKTDLSGRPEYAAEKIGDFLADADLTHTSNEVSFVPGCKPSDGLRFCSAPEYIKALEISGVDIVELTGNHNNDFGASYNAQSIEMYKEKGWDYFGGGLNSTDASKILYKELNGTKLAFVGYNYYDTIYESLALAGSERAGANSYSEGKLKSDIEKARESADTVIVTFQFQECYSYPSSDVIYPICYKPLANPDQERVFRQAVDFGADVVVGTQAHQPQTYEIYKGKLIFYGLGNIFFDQTPWIGTRHGIVLTHYFLDGKLLQTKLTTTIYDGDMQTYVTEGEQRELLLNLLHEARK